MIEAKRHYTDHSPAVCLELTRSQLEAIFKSCAELEVVLIEQYRHLHPHQKKHIKVCVRHLKRFQVWPMLEAALEAADSQEAQS